MDRGQGICLIREAPAGLRRMEEIQTETAGVALEMPVEEPPTRIVRKHPAKTAGLSTARKEIRKQEMAEAGIA